VKVTGENEAGKRPPDRCADKFVPMR